MLPGAIPSLTPGVPDLGVQLVGGEHHHDVALAGGVGGLEHRQPVLGGLGDAGRLRAQPDDDVDAGVLEVQRVGVALRAVADDRDGLAVELVEVSVVVVEHWPQATRARPGPPPPLARVHRSCCLKREASDITSLTYCWVSVYSPCWPAPTAAPGSTPPRRGPRCRRSRPAASAAAARRPRTLSVADAGARGGGAGEVGADVVPGPGLDLHHAGRPGAGHEVVVEAALLPADRLGQRSRHAVGWRDRADLGGLTYSGVGWAPPVPRPATPARRPRRRSRAGESPEVAADADELGRPRRRASSRTAGPRWRLRPLAAASCVDGSVP